MIFLIMGNRVAVYCIFAPVNILLQIDLIINCIFVNNLVRLRQNNNRK